ncbi:TPA: hypothetical protein U9I93_003934 [Acinetobacter baumannii]|nr:hypothetical protein [Acinetobacter baumannii]HEN9537567.1 hypothetical protein [Acinetobacter baumannii]
MNICIETPNKFAWDEVQKKLFKLGFDWEREEYPEFDFDLQVDVWKTESSFILNDDGWHQDVSHICVIDSNLFVNYKDDGDPIKDGFKLVKLEDL